MRTNDLEYNPELERRLLLDRIKSITNRLWEYCRTNDWAGFDPYDALNSNVLKNLRFLDTPTIRLALTQLLKHSPLNLRPILQVPKTHNPKTIALCLSSLIKLSSLGLVREEDLIPNMVTKLRALRSWGSTYRGWGYSFPWQTRTKIVPRGVPNLICTVFTANALLDAFERNKDPECLAMADEASDLIFDELYWTQTGYGAGFGYPLPSIREHIHNANFLGAAYLCRIHRFNGKNRYLAAAFDVARFSVSKQNSDGSWFYGESERTRWIDNFHTGYNLVGLHEISKLGQTSEFNLHLIKGLEYYINNFFRDDGVPRYYHDRTYPIDIHCAAQSVITLLACRELNRSCYPLAQRVLWWAIENMWCEKGYFCYQRHPLYKNKISYIRWSQAWMLLALSRALESLPPGSDWASPDSKTHDKIRRLPGAENGRG